MTAAELCRRAAEMHVRLGYYTIGGALYDAAVKLLASEAAFSEAKEAAYSFRPYNATPDERVLALLFAAALLEDE